MIYEMFFIGFLKSKKEELQKDIIKTDDEISQRELQRGFRMSHLGALYDHLAGSCSAVTKVHLTFL